MKLDASLSIVIIPISNVFFSFLTHSVTCNLCNLQCYVLLIEEKNLLKQHYLMLLYNIIPRLSPEI